MKFVFFAALIAVVVVGALLQNRADEKCRARAREGVMLCRAGPPYAIVFVGDVECACSE
jgi:hypothetical protein